MPIGVYRTSEGQVQVAYGRKHRFTISRKQYEDKGYEPAFDRLPFEHDVRADEEQIQENSEQLA